MNADTKCHKCGRKYIYDYCLAEFRETIESERVKRPRCSYCQKTLVEINAGSKALARAMGRR